MMRAFIWGFGWTLGRYAAVLLIVILSFLLFTKEGLQTLGVILLMAVLLAISVPTMLDEWDREDRAYAICMKDPAKLPGLPAGMDPDTTWNNYDGSFMGKESWCKYQKKLVAYQLATGVRQHGEWW